MANWYEDFAKAMDPQPADVATIFAGARAAVPIYALMGSTGLNEGEDEALRKLYGPMPKPSMPPLSEEDEQSRMIADFERQFPTPELRRAALQHMRAVRTNKAYDPSTATRRVDFMPQGTGPEMRSTPPRTRNTDLMRAPPARRAFAGGGSAKKTVQQMADELLMKGTKVADKPDLARRSLFGLKAQPAMDFPLARIDDKALTRLEKEFGKEGKAPTLTEKTTTVSPDAGATKSTLKSITETPVSRRTVLKSAAGQAMQSMLPMSELSALGRVASPAAYMAEVVKPVVTPAMIPGLVAKFIKEGMSEEDAVKRVVNEFASHYRHSPAQVKELKENLDYVDLPNRLEFPEADLESMTDDLTSPSGAWNYLTGLQDLIPKDISYGELKQSMRHLRNADPDAYARMRNASKDFAATSAEAAVERGEKVPFNVRTDWGGYGPAYKHLLDD